MRKYGSYDKPPTTKEFIDQAIASDTDDCILWPYAKNKGGYGIFTHEKKKHLVHRFVLNAVDPCPDPSLFCLHSCDTPACINPKHLRWGTQQNNMDDMVSRGRAEPRKLSEKQEREVAFIYAQGKKLQRELAKQYNVSVTTIQGAIKRNSK